MGEDSGRKGSQPWRPVGGLCSDSEWNGSCRVLNRGATCSKIIERLTLAVLLRTDQGIEEARVKPHRFFAQIIAIALTGSPCFSLSWQTSLYFRVLLSATDPVSKTQATLYFPTKSTPWEWHSRPIVIWPPLAVPASSPTHTMGTVILLWFCSCCPLTFCPAKFVFLKSHLLLRASAEAPSQDESL